LDSGFVFTEYYTNTDQPTANEEEEEGGRVCVENMRLRMQMCETLRDAKDATCEFAYMYYEYWDDVIRGKCPSPIDDMVGGAQAIAPLLVAGAAAARVATFAPRLAVRGLWTLIS